MSNESTQKSLISAGKVIRYATLPGVVPRVKELFGSGFGWLAYLMALIYNSVRLIPSDHPYLSSSNIGRFGVRHVIAEAANNLQFSKKNIDQIVVFAAMLTGFVILVMQFVLLIMGVVFTSAEAAAAANSVDFNSFFVTLRPENDIAYMMMDRVFGIPDMFGSRFATTAGNILPFHQGLHGLFAFYNVAMLIIGVFILLYYIVVVVGETAQSGTPFGKRFNHVWAPIRLVVAVGLLIPLAHGLNTAQYITLHVAKFGSSFATNAWLTYNSSLENVVGERSNESLLAHPKAGQVTSLVGYMALVQTCRAIYDIDGLFDPKPDIKPYVVTSLVGSEEIVTNAASAGAAASVSPTYEDITDNFKYGGIDIRFGAKNAGSFNRGGVDPLCGQIKVGINDAHQAGAQFIQESYYNLISALWEDEFLIAYGQRMATMVRRHPNHSTPCDVRIPNNLGDRCDPRPEGRDTVMPTSSFKTSVVATYQAQIDVEVERARDRLLQDMEAGGDFALPDELKAYGWGGAGIWYNYIAEWNGSLIGAALNLPRPTQMPAVMEKVNDEKRKRNANVSPRECYSPVLRDGDVINLNGNEKDIALALSAVCKDWIADESHIPPSERRTGNIIFDAAIVLFGGEGVFDMRDNADINPMAQLVSIGKSIIETSTRNLMVGMLFSAGGGISGMLGWSHMGSAIEGISDILISMTSAGIVIGFILFYVLPFLPFMYFFFSVSGWVKGIFEAMVGVPLWALAHIRIDKDGLPGDAASQGYFLLFDIFVRPVMCVFGLIVGMALFSVQVRVMNGIFDIAIVNLVGGSGDCLNCPQLSALGEIEQEFKRDVIDELFYTIIYAIIVYMIGTSSFKLIDEIPKSILRWMGSSAKTFNDQREDPTQGLVQYAAFGGEQITNQVTDGVKKFANEIFPRPTDKPAPKGPPPEADGG